MYDLIYGGSDLFDMPSTFEPCGLSDKEAAASRIMRHLRDVDGLADKLVTRGELTEGFKVFNPVYWLSSLMKMYDVYRYDRPAWREVQYQLLTQDARWIDVARNRYMSGWMNVLGEEPVPEIRTLEVASAIHRARKQKDPADELMKAGYTAREAVDHVVRAIRSSRRESLVRALLTKHLRSLAKIDEETRRYLLEQLEKARKEEPRLVRIESALSALGRSEVREAGIDKGYAPSRRDGLMKKHASPVMGFADFSDLSAEPLYSPSLFQDLPAPRCAPGRRRMPRNLGIILSFPASLRPGCRVIFWKSLAKFGEEIAGLVAATTMTGGLGALMHDLAPPGKRILELRKRT